MVMRPTLNFGTLNDISGTAKTRIVKLCKQVDCFLAYG